MKETVAIIGAGMGGLSAAITLAAAGFGVTVIEAAQEPGGKLRQVSSGGRLLDAGPTVLTMKWVFDDLLSRCGTSLADEIGLDKCDVIGRHYWQGGQQLDLFADVAESRRAVADFAGAREAAGFQRFAEDSARVYQLLERSFIDASRPNPISLSARIGLHRPNALLALKPFSALWPTLESYFSDRRLIQLFGRYATYCGSSPYLAPATLMLVAHVEQAGVWTVKGGMHALARRMADIARDFGVEFHFDEKVASIDKDGSGKAVRGVTTDRERHIPAQNVIYNGDVAALSHLLGDAPSPRGGQQRSLSALVACGVASPTGVPLSHHTVFFSENYGEEFDAVFGRSLPPDDPTVYVCAQDRPAQRDGSSAVGSGAAERIYCLMNMPANGDSHGYSKSEVDRCLSSMERRLRRNGLRLDLDRQTTAITTPDRFAKLYPGTGGALYGMASHGWMASFSRPAARGPLGGLYLAGGSVHPGPGVPMAALSGKIAAERLMADMALHGRSRRGAITGGMRMRSATADVSPSR
ncbi:1-hydroxycarotenoid 3,4-desaturase CrtD [Rhizobium sp. RU36D]|uniref:1-hydroxycarotenoid 3,4-desaturase CrtD n=1 Tax=Rhizobium sp. RU36D TaxID=1907415 RepID=UPI0009D90B86|nr:1-hydroxycarotenoid 3,4-desaturase CrtD [Rhizobium sp. RU36D]SMC53217.1 1-hydroxycarotenoid 3,4-desaturase [Rhizobium sp. RU36D]